MNRYPIFLLIFFSFFFEPSYAHQDFYTLKDFGNVKVRIKTGYKYEEINKVMIIGQLAQKLCLELNYSKTVFLDFEHDYTKVCQADYFVSFDKGKIKYLCGNCGEDEYLKDTAIVIREINRTFDAMSTLKLLEYAINNAALIASNQKEITNSCRNWQTMSIDPEIIKSELSKNTSPLLIKISTIRVERPENEFEYGVSYFWQGNKYHFFYRDSKISDKVILTLDNVYMFERFSNTHSFIFETDSTFYYQFPWPEPSVSKKHQIENIYTNFQPFRIRDIDGDKYSISFYAYTKEEGIQPRNKTLIYLVRKDELIQDLDKLIESQRE